MSRRLRVFVCSTRGDLLEERRVVLDAISRLRLEHNAMEGFGARDELPIETCLAEVAESDVVVVIVGRRYGSLVPGGDVSFSEAEYLEAWRLGKPCLVYLRSEEDGAALPGDAGPDPEERRRLERWKGELQEHHTVVAFRNPHDLALQVAADLGRHLAAHLSHTEPPSGARQPPSSTPPAPASSPARAHRVPPLMTAAVVVLTLGVIGMASLGLWPGGEGETVGNPLQPSDSGRAGPPAPANSPAGPQPKRPGNEGASSGAAPEPAGSPASDTEAFDTLLSQARSRVNGAPKEACRLFREAFRTMPADLSTTVDRALLDRADSACSAARTELEYIVAAQVFESAFRAVPRA